MNTRRLKQMLVAVPVMGCAVLLIALAAPAAAQSEACIHVQTGTPYSAGIQVTYGNQSESTNPLTNPITPGATQCLSLTAVPDGVEFSVAVLVLAGGPIGPPSPIPFACTPSNIPRSATLPVAITFNASGTFKDLHCTAPSSLVE